MRGYFDPKGLGLSSVLSGFLSPGSVTSGDIASGQVGSVHLADGSILTIDIASGQVQSGQIGSGAVTGHGGGGAFCLASGTVSSFDLGSGSIVSGRIASGQIGTNHLAAGSVQSGNVVSGNIAKQHTASGLLQASLQFVIDGGGVALASGEKGDIIVPFDCKLNYLNIFSDQSGGSVFAGIWKDNYAAYPPTSGDTIAASGVPLISGAIRNTYSGTAALSGWTTAFTKGDVLKFVIHSGLTQTRVCIAMQVGVGD